jgi:hypothetical protein
VAIPSQSVGPLFGLLHTEFSLSLSLEVYLGQTLALGYRCLPRPNDTMEGRRGTLSWHDMTEVFCRGLLGWLDER